MKVEVGRPGAPAGGPRPLFDDSCSVCSRFMFAREAAEGRSEQLGKAARSPTVDQAGRLANAQSENMQTVSQEIAVFAVQHTRFARPRRGQSPTLTTVVQIQSLPAQPASRNSGGAKAEIYQSLNAWISKELGKAARSATVDQ